MTLSAGAPTRRPEASARARLRGRPCSLCHTRSDQGWTFIMLTGTLMFALFLGVRSRARPPKTRHEFAQLMADISYTNETLLGYFFPAEPPPQPPDVQQTWWVQTPKCKRSQTCWCVHVTGSRDKTVNPNPRACEWTKGKSLMTRSMDLGKCNYRGSRHNCSCTTGAGEPCLSSNMNPGTIVSNIALARRGGVKHIIEEGREGGLTALIYWLHGFTVTSIEYSPIDEVSTALREMAPGVVQLDGDGRQLVPELVRNMSRREAAQTMIFFDGEKRTFAYDTFGKVKDRVAFAAFDDATAEFGRFMSTKGEIWWQVATEPLYDPMIKRMKESRGRLSKAGLRGSTDALGDLGQQFFTFGDTLFTFGGGWGRGGAHDHVQGAA